METGWTVISFIGFLAYISGKLNAKCNRLPAIFKVNLVILRYRGILVSIIARNVSNLR